jgi:tetratricopeptide (TPR) repeat protein
MVRTAIVAAFLTAWFCSGFVARADDNSAFDKSVAEYTKKIAEGKTRAYSDRASLYLDKGYFNLALADYNKMIELWPGSHDAYRQRAEANRRMGRYGPAIDDLGNSIRLGGKNHHDRGLLYRLTGAYERAVEDFSRVIEQDPESAEEYANRGTTWILAGRNDMAKTDFIFAWRRMSSNAPRWRDASDFWSGRFLLLRILADAKAGEDGISNLEENVKGIDPEKWPGPILGLYLGKKTPDDVRSAAMRGEDADERTLQNCEAAFFIGEFELSRRRMTAARPFFEEAKKVCPPLYSEYSLAVWELKRMADGGN